jgi:hypothetical protein
VPKIPAKCNGPVELASNALLCLINCISSNNDRSPITLFILCCDDVVQCENFFRSVFEPVSITCMDLLGKRFISFRK